MCAHLLSTGNNKLFSRSGGAIYTPTSPWALGLQTFLSFNTGLFFNFLHLYSGWFLQLYIPNLLLKFYFFSQFHLSRSFIIFWTLHFYCHYFLAIAGISSFIPLTILITFFGRIFFFLLPSRWLLPPRCLFRLFLSLSALLDTFLKCLKTPGYPPLFRSVARTSVGLGNFVLSCSHQSRLFPWQTVSEDQEVFSWAAQIFQIRLFPPPAGEESAARPQILGTSGRSREWCRDCHLIFRMLLWPCINKPPVSCQCCAK